MSENNKNSVTAFFHSMTGPKTYGSFTKIELNAKIIDGQYTNWVVFDATGKTMDLLLKDPPSQGDELSISYALSGRFNDRYQRVFNTLRAYFVRNLSNSSSSQSQAPQQQQSAPAKEPPPMPSFQDESDEGLPF